MSPRKALDQSLLQQLQHMRESPVGEDAQQNKKRTRLDVAPGKSISNLDFFSSESESGSETESAPESEPEKSNIEENDDADDEQQVITLSDISVGDFALVKYNYSRSVRYYIGEYMEKDSNGQILFIFLERICGSLFKYRGNVLLETANINMVKNVLVAPTVTCCGGKFDFKSSSKIIDCLRYLY